MTQPERKIVPLQSGPNPATGSAAPAVNVVLFGDFYAEATSQAIKHLRNLGVRVRIAPDIDEYFSNSYLNDNVFMLEWQRREFITLNALKHIRSLSNHPLLILGTNSEEVDRVISLELGADDFLSAALDPREILARIRAVIRRSGPIRTAETEAYGYYRFADWKFDKKTMRLLQSGKDAVYLTRVELSLLIAFMDSPLRILSRSYLASVTHIHGRVTDRAVDVQILRLRKKLGSDIIESIRGQGYRFTENVEYVNQA